MTDAAERPFCLFCLINRIVLFCVHLHNGAQLKLSYDSGEQTQRAVISGHRAWIVPSPRCFCPGPAARSQQRSGPAPPPPLPAQLPAERGPFPLLTPPAPDLTAPRGRPRRRRPLLGDAIELSRRLCSRWRTGAGKAKAPAARPGTPSRRMLHSHTAQGQAAFPLGRPLPPGQRRRAVTPRRRPSVPCGWAGDYSSRHASGLPSRGAVSRLPLAAGGGRSCCGHARRLAAAERAVGRGGEAASSAVSGRAGSGGLGLFAHRRGLRGWEGRIPGLSPPTPLPAVASRGGGGWSALPWPCLPGLFREPSAPTERWAALPGRASAPLE